MQYPMFATPERHAVMFRSLLDDDSLTFPCDQRGTVDLDGLGDRQRHAYLYARALIGHSFASPVVVCVEWDQ
jgi:hypothetical protein